MANQKNKIKFLLTKKKEIEKSFQIKIEYLELRKKNNLKISKTLSNSRLFIAYYMRKIRLIDNF